MSKEFIQNSATIDIRLKAVPVEAPQSMSTVERYHAPVGKAYRIIRPEAPSLDKVAALKTAVKAVNDSVGPHGLIPTFLVYRAIPQLGLPSDPPSVSLYQRALALKFATKEVTEYFAQSKLSSALNARNGPCTTDVHNIPLGGHVLVYRPTKDRWEGSYSLLHKEGEDFTVLMEHGISKFRSRSFKPHYPPSP